MKPKARNLTIRMRGADVKLLQENLMKLGFSIPGSEQEKKYFGSGTRKAVLEFQRKNNLTATGELDEVTAALLSQRTDAPEFVVHGTVRNQDGAPKPGLTVKAFDRNIGADDTLLGQATTDAEGNYSILYMLEQLSGKTAADMVISVYLDATLLQNSDIIFNAQLTETKDFIISVAPLPEFQHLADKIGPLLRNKIGLTGRATCKICCEPIHLGKDGSWHHRHKKLTVQVIERMKGKRHRPVPKIN